MASPKDRLNAGLARLWPEQRLFLRSDHRTIHLRLTPLAQAGISVALVLGLTWMLVATAAFALTLIESDSREDQIALLRETYSDRLLAVTAERDAAARAAASARDRFQDAMAQVSAQQAELMRASGGARADALTLAVVRQRLAEAIQLREQALRDNAALSADLQAMTASLQSRSGDEVDLAQTLQTVSAALHDTLRRSEAAETDLAALTGRVITLEGRESLEQAEQARVLGRLEEAITLSLGALGGSLRNTGIDLDSLIEDLRSSYGGTGGPLTQRVAPPGPWDRPQDPRITGIFEDLERLQLLRLATAKLPLAVPVRESFRFTSGFGVRKDPRGRSFRQHLGIDLAGRRGTPVLTTADGEVIFAGRQSGYGNVVKIRHAFGLETVYGHLQTIRVRVGDRVALGDRIGDMGNTGRSTGTHLHYEIRVNGTAVNPMTYLKAAKDVL